MEPGTLKPRTLLTTLVAAALCIGALGGHLWTRQRERNRCLFFLHGTAQSAAHAEEMKAWRAYLSEPPAVGAWALENLAALFESLDRQFGGPPFGEGEWKRKAGSAHALLAKRYRSMGDTGKLIMHEVEARKRLDPGQDVFQHADLMERALPKALKEGGE